MHHVTGFRKRFIPGTDDNVGETSSAASSSSNNTVVQDENDETIYSVYQWGIGSSVCPSLHGITSLVGKKISMVACSTQKIVVVDEKASGQSIYVWGDNSLGQCGLGARARYENQSGKMVPIEVIEKPTKLTNISAFGIVGVAARPGLSVLLDKNGTIHLAGHWNHASQPKDTFEPFHGINAHIEQVVLGSSHQAVLARDSTTDRNIVYTWGRNENGQLGHSQVGCIVDTPKEVEGFPARANIVQIASGTHHMLALTSDRQLFAWGKNVHVSPSDLDPDNKPPILGTRETTPIVARPALVKFPILRKIQPFKIAASTSYSMMIDRSGKVYSWGESTHGGIGQGNDVNYMATPTQSKHPPDAIDVSCGLQHTISLHQSGSLYVCGYGRRGSLGLGSDRDVYNPTELLFYGQRANTLIFDTGQYATLAVFPLIANPTVHWFNDRARQTCATLEEVSGSAERIPPIITDSIRFVEANPDHLNAEGIYRKESPSTHKRILQTLWQTGEPLVDFPDSIKNVYNVTCVLKIFLRSIREPLFTFAKYEEFFEASEPQHDPAQKILRLGRLLRSLPPLHWRVARLIYLHGMKVIAHESGNRMGLEAVSRMWGNISLASQDTSPTALLRQGRVGDVAKPILQYGAIILNDFMFSLFENLIVQGKLPSEVVFETCANISTFAIPRNLQNKWHTQLQTAPNAPTSDPNVEHAAQQKREKISAEMDRLETEQKQGKTNQGALYTQILALLRRTNECYLNQSYNHPVTRVIFDVARHILLLQRIPPVTANQRQLNKRIRRAPHPIQTASLDYLGEDPATIVQRSLQQLAHREFHLEKQIQQFEHRLAILWREIDAEKKQYKELFEAKLEKFLAGVNTVVAPFATTEEMNRCSSTLKLQQDIIARALNLVLTMLDHHNPFENLLNASASSSSTLPSPRSALISSSELTIPQREFRELIGTLVRYYEQQPKSFRQKHRNQFIHLKSFLF
eukprot:CAMPEP_0201561586 /NCGR_PEP_ID=MMETSP0173_2-20130828/78873_1 /ASSEMBLY_ACC=CAM_ASM_000268 /TAXON_ID=218659 /ORGANISM="Vexillifera sp., Strain DIVA3 564/2" /LENGTH=973 /DNA_ID=CAMNT_0047976099 /DNA_START=2821 /DNA_END=5742 /DNA_ORIENTATION=+